MQEPEDEGHDPRPARAEARAAARLVDRHRLVEHLVEDHRRADFQAQKHDQPLMLKDGFLADDIQIEVWSPESVQAVRLGVDVRDLRGG